MTLGEREINPARNCRATTRIRRVSITAGVAALMALAFVSVASPASAVEATVGLGTAQAYSVLACLWAGATAVVMPRFSASRFGACRWRTAAPGPRWCPSASRR